MITKQDLIEAIAECEGERNPNANTCIKLAAFYTILDHFDGEKTEPPKTTSNYSYENTPTVKYSNSEFSKIVQDIGWDNCFSVVDELMGTIYIIDPSLYRSVIRKLREI